MGWREFSPGFEYKRCSNTVVEISNASPSAGGEPKRLCWRFGRVVNEKELKFGYIMELSHKDSDHNVMNLEWQYGGHQCKGVYQVATGAISLNFFLKTSTVSFTYRIVDHDTMALCIVEVDNEHLPTVQIGHMCRRQGGNYGR